MDADQEQKREFDRMRGEYLGLMASIELNLTLLTAEWLDVESHREEFQRWFVEAPIPFRSKVRLYEAMTSSSSQLDQLGDLPQQMRESYDFRNTLAHSFRQFGGLTTSRGVEVPAATISLDVLETKLQQLARLDNLVINLLGWAIEGPPQPVFTDDYADWPQGVFLP